MCGETGLCDELDFFLKCLKEMKNHKIESGEFNINVLIYFSH